MLLPVCAAFVCFVYGMLYWCSLQVCVVPDIGGAYLGMSGGRTPDEAWPAGWSREGTGGSGGGGVGGRALSFNILYTQRVSKYSNLIYTKQKLGLVQVQKNSEGDKLEDQGVQSSQGFRRNFGTASYKSLHLWQFLLQHKSMLLKYHYGRYHHTIAGCRNRNLSHHLPLDPPQHHF